MAWNPELLGQYEAEMHEKRVKAVQAAAQQDMEHELHRLRERVKELEGRTLNARGNSPARLAARSERGGSPM